MVIDSRPVELENLHFKDFPIFFGCRQQKAHAITIIKANDKLRPLQDFPKMDQGDSRGQRPEELILLRPSRPDLSHPFHIFNLQKPQNEAGA